MRYVEQDSATLKAALENIRDNAHSPYNPPDDNTIWMSSNTTLGLYIDSILCQGDFSNEDNSSN